MKEAQQIEEFTEPIPNQSYLPKIFKVHLVWYLINFITLFLQSHLSFEITYINNIFIILFKIIAKIIFISFLLYWSTINYNLSFQKLGITFKNFIQNCSLGISLSWPVLIGVIVIHLALPNKAVTPIITITTFKELNLSLIYFLALFIGFLIPAFSKELLYRAFIYSQFKEEHGFLVGSIISNIYYTLSYFDLRVESMIVHLIVGVITTYLYERTDSIIASTIFQTTYQASLTLYLFSFSNWPL